MGRFLQMLNEKKDNDLADIPAEYAKLLKPYEGDIESAYVDDKLGKTIIYLDNKDKLDDIKKLLGKNINKIEQTEDDIKIILESESDEIDVVDSNRKMLGKKKVSFKKDSVTYNGKEYLKSKKSGIDKDTKKPTTQYVSDDDSELWMTDDKSKIILD